MVAFAGGGGYAGAVAVLGAFAVTGAAAILRTKTGIPAAVSPERKLLKDESAGLIYEIYKRGCRKFGLSGTDCFGGGARQCPFKKVGTGCQGRGERY